MQTESGIGVLILAAGNSSRMGQPKQLLLYKNKTLLRHIAEVAIAAVNTPVAVISGAYTDLIQDELSSLPVYQLHNPFWQEGIASSIRMGVLYLTQHHPNLTGIILCVSDQPYIEPVLLESLINNSVAAPHKIIACSYDNTLGTPVLFSASYYDALITLKGAEGAKKLLRKYSDEVIPIPFLLGGIDIDTPEDYQRLMDL